ncbi:glycosyl hydrolase [Flavobacterium reichenbachii]|uniref:Glycoside hydrolase n=1 Tax=Flavobacterium reichenbachii TaxID=362418 RepID=A0A085ZEZ7_9FLAO|nr:glycosyl hydrolase [Flavobacterium reichenbachii]KFF03011.1 glycoside hydrolase [Flavobacterium reichenbachii]OXB08838.1 glycoside hydrolase [Flavobacterium reichenbachii]
MKRLKKYSFITLFVFGALTSYAQKNTNPWPASTNINQPWARWWWMGSAVDKPNLKKSLIDFSKAGIGGVEITPIYGVKGEEKNFIDYLSPKWMEMLDYTVHVADSLHMQVDMVLGTGWPYGGPQVTLQNAATKLIVEKYQIKKDETINKNIMLDTTKEKIPAQLLYVVAYGSDGSFVNLTDQVKHKKIKQKKKVIEGTSIALPNILQSNLLKWKAKKTDYSIYAVFSGKTGQQVKRAAPGGKGYTLDHYSKEALNAYVMPFNDAFKGREGKIRAIFNDSYEVYGTDFTPNFFEEFKKLRGYDLKKELPKLLNEKDNEIGNRIRSDYRQTISDLLLNKFDKTWTDWAHSKKFKTKLQAHGSPGNLIDLYASADIPECETFGSMPFAIPGFRREKEDIREGDADPVMLKFSSSAAHISGKNLVSSETFTWLREHFKTALSQCKPEAEELMLNGVNHIFLHGSTYSPERAAWPGWKFYASVNFNSNNTIWEDAPSLFSYISNCQSMLQQGKPDNELLMYWPVFDVWDKYQNGNLFFQFKIHSLSEWLYGTSFYYYNQALIKKGYGIDYVSDDFIDQANVVNGQITLPGGNYKAMVIPSCRKMPLATLQKLIELKKAGAVIIFGGLPKSVPGYNDYEKQEQQLQTLLIENKEVVKVPITIDDALSDAQINPESLVISGLKYIRRTVNGEKIYYVVNHGPVAVGPYIPLQALNKEVIIFDPLTGDYGNGIVIKREKNTFVQLTIEPGKSYFLKTENTASQKKWVYYEKTAKPVELKGNWKLSFDKGGPKLPANTSVSKLESWTKLSPDAEAFSGTATYTLEFENSNTKTQNWGLNLGDVRESAKVWINDEFIGTAWSVPYQLNIGKLKSGKNTLKIQVTNLAANRIRDMELKGQEWKIFYEINMVDKDYKKFDATKWTPMPSGLLGPVTITPLQPQN